MSKQITNHWSFTLFSSLLSSSLCCMQHQNSRLSHTHSKLKGPGGIRHSCDRRWKEGIIIMILSIMIEFILSLSMEIALFSIFASSVIFFLFNAILFGGVQRYRMCQIQRDLAHPVWYRRVNQRPFFYSLYLHLSYLLCDVYFKWSALCIYLFLLIHLHLHWIQGVLRRTGLVNLI